MVLEANLLPPLVPSPNEVPITRGMTSADGFLDLPVTSSPVSDFSREAESRTRRWLGKNIVQRVLSALVLVPLITVFLWLSPAFATATFCTFVTSICSYEYAWLQHRIYLRVMNKINNCEAELLQRDADTNQITALSRDINVSRLSTSFIRFTQRESGTSNTAGYVRENTTGDAFTNSDRTLISTSDECIQSSRMIPPPPPESTGVTPELARHSYDNTLQEDCEVSNDPSLSSSAVSTIASRFFCRNEWVAAIALSAITTFFTTTLFLVYVNHISGLQEKQLYKLRWFYSIATDFVAALCAFFTPNWKYAFICIIEKVVFTLLTLHSTACPMNTLSCGIFLEPAQVFLSGVVVIVCFRLQIRTSAPATFLHIAVDMLGYFYIIGGLSVIVAFVDDERLESYRKLLIVLLYVVWASDTGAYLTGKLLERMKYGYYNPLASHLSKNKDYEGTLGAIFFGVTAMIVSSHLLNVPGSAAAQIGFTVMAVIVGRLGDLFESLLKRAAGVKDSGKLIPGHGGVLDRIDALMFSALVFARYYASVVS
ncbi:putative phosphatidate cytidylyltransferase [Plasmopara halstedii]